MFKYCCVHMVSGIRRRLQNSLVLVGEIGGNDYNYAFFGNSSVKEVEKLIPGVVRTITDAAKVKHNYLWTCAKLGMAANCHENC